MADEFLELVEPLEREMFLQGVQEGLPPLHAAIAVGWSPAKLRKVMRDASFAELVEEAEEFKDQTVELMLFRQAQKGNMAAIQMWLYNRQPARWKDVKRIEMRSETNVQVSVVASVKEAALALLREEGVPALQQGILDAEVVEDGESDDA